jgi:hypothetical protein
MGVIAANQGRLRHSERLLGRALGIYHDLGSAPFDERLTQTALQQVQAMISAEAR